MFSLVFGSHISHLIIVVFCLLEVDSRNSKSKLLEIITSLSIYIKLSNIILNIYYYNNKWVYKVFMHKMGSGFFFLNYAEIILLWEECQNA